MINPLNQLIEITLKCSRVQFLKRKQIMETCHSDNHKFDETSVVNHLKCPSTFFFFLLKHLMTLD